MKINLRLTTVDDIHNVIDAERHSDNCNFVYQWSEQEHVNALSNANLRHYTVSEAGSFVGYVILDQLQDVSQSINLRRIVITKKNLGIGRVVIDEIKRIVFHELQAHRLWLDVFVDNLRAYQLYKKCHFREEGKLIDSYLRKDGYASQYIMAILKEEYHKPN